LTSTNCSFVNYTPFVLKKVHDRLGSKEFLTCKCREEKYFGILNILLYFLVSTHGRGYRIRTRSNKSDFEKKKAVIMNYIMGLPRFGIKEKVAIQKTSEEHAKLLKKTSPTAIKEIPTETHIEKKKTLHRTHNPFAIRKGSTERR